LQQLTGCVEAQLSSHLINNVKQNRQQ